MDNSLALLLAGFVSLVMLLAQLKLFSIDTTLKEILSELRQRQKEGAQASAAKLPPN